MADQQRAEADVVAQPGVLEQLQQPDARDECRQHQRSERQRGNGGASAKLVAHQRERQRQREQRADHRGEAAELEAEHQRIDPLRREGALPPLQREAPRRELRAVRCIERHCRRDEDRAEHEHIHADHDQPEHGPRAHDANLPSGSDPCRADRGLTPITAPPAWRRGGPLRK